MRRPRRHRRSSAWTGPVHTVCAVHGHRGMCTRPLGTYPARVDHAPPPHALAPADAVPLTDDPEISALLDAIPITAEHPRTVVDLPGGLTNRNLKVTTPSATVVVRIPGPGSELLEIDRDAEYRNSVAAAQAGVGPPVVHHRPGQGISVEFLPGRTLTDDDLAHPEILVLVATACRKLHAGPRFVGDFDMFAVQARYRDIVARHG